MPTGVYKRKSFTKEHRENLSKNSARFQLGKTLKEMGHKLNCPCCMCKAERGIRKGKNHPGYRHGGSKTRLFWVWINMRKRCLNPKIPSYSRYGGRGIKVCDEWRNSFVVFRDFALSHGYKEGLTIDRIDNDGNYEPSNVQFITKGENTSKDHY